MPCLQVRCGGYVKHLLFTCTRAREVWSALWVSEVIDKYLMLDRSGLVVLEAILCSNQKDVPVLNDLGFKELIAIGCCYIWWQRREFVKGVSVAKPSSSAFAISALTANHMVAQSHKASPKMMWSKPLPGSYKLNVDAAYQEVMVSFTMS